MVRIFKNSDPINTYLSYPVFKKKKFAKQYYDG